MIRLRTSVPWSFPEFPVLRGDLKGAPVPGQVCFGKPVLLGMDMSVYCSLGREDLVVAMIRCNRSMRDYNIIRKNQAGTVSLEI